MQDFNQIKSFIETASADAEKFYQNGNAAAGTRLRKAMLEVKKLCGSVRKDVSERKSKA